jgi:hypothetical protein
MFSSQNYKLTHGQTCLEQHGHSFSPSVVSTDGLLGTEIMHLAKEKTALLALREVGKAVLFLGRKIST